MPGKYPASFITAISTSGTKEEAIRYLQETWDELVEARKTIREMKKEMQDSVKTIIN